MTTFTSDDREEAYKKILAEAPAHIGYEDAVDPVACGVTINVEPIPFAGMVTLTETVPKSKPAAWFYMRPGETGTFMCADAEAMKGIEKDGWVTTPLYLHPVKELTDFEIKGVLALDECWIGEDCSMPNMISFAKAILRKAQEK